MNNKDYDFRNETGTWQTGRTQPPKRYVGLVAFLLVLVILLSGISTALSIMNIKLYRKLSDVQSSAPMTFSRSADASPQPTEAAEHEEIREQNNNAYLYLQTNKLNVSSLPGAVLSYADKKVPKEPA